MTKREINEVRELRSEINDLERKIELKRGALMNIVPLRDGLPRARGLESRIEVMTVEIAEQSAELEKLKARRELAKAKIVGAICAANLNGHETAVIYRRYVKCMRFRDIGFEMGYSDAHVFYLHRHAMKKLTGADKNV